MDHEILVNEQIEVGRKVIAEFEKLLPVKIAFWLKETDRAFWYLHLASDSINPYTLRDAYDKLCMIVSLIRDPNLDPFRINLIGSDDPLAIAAMNAYLRLESPIPIYIQNDIFGGVGVEGVYIYPPHEFATV